MTNTQATHWLGEHSHNDWVNYSYCTLDTHTQTIYLDCCVLSRCALSPKLPKQTEFGVEVPPRVEDQLELKRHDEDVVLSGKLISYVLTMYLLYK